MASKGITLPITYKADLTGLNQASSAMDGFGKKTWHVAITDRHNSRRG